MELSDMLGVCEDLDRCSLTAHRWLRHPSGIVKESKEYCSKSLYAKKNSRVTHLIDGRLDTVWTQMLCDPTHGTGWVVFEFPEATTPKPCHCSLTSRSLGSTGRVPQACVVWTVSRWCSCLQSDSIAGPKRSAPRHPPTQPAT